MKIDLHCHSKYSNRPILWIMQKLGCPESFTEPVELYHLQRHMGMDAVTITDHNVIGGCLDIMHLPNTFMGCEYTTYFPEDGCKVHVLVYNFTEAQHREITELRKNIFEFTAYCRQQGLPHACAHPLFGPNERLTPDHVEQLALLYKHWEVNGDQTPIMNAVLEAIVADMSPAQFERLADKHGFMPDYDEPWKKILVGGTDCHSSLHLGRTFTEIDGAEDLDGFWRGFAAGNTRVHLEQPSPKSFSRNVYGIMFQFYKSKLGLDRHVNKDLILRFVDKALHTRPETPDSWMERLYFALAKRRRRKDPAPGKDTLINLAKIEAERLIRKDPLLMQIVNEGAGNGDIDDVWFQFVNEMANQMTVSLGGQIMDRVMAGRFFELFHSLGSAAALYALMAPYFASYSHYQFERTFSHEVLDRFMGDRAPERFRQSSRVGHFTDTLSDVNGVARTLTQQAALAAELGKHYTVMTCAPEKAAPVDNVRTFVSGGAFTIPEYPELQLLAPPMLEMLDYCYEQEFTHLHVATPGPIGLAGIAIARILRLPVSGTYHTAFPEYAKALTDDAYVEDIAWKYMVWFYDQLDAVYVPSWATARQLIERGIKEEKIKVYPRGIDIERFHPREQCGVYEDQYRLPAGETRLLYVGRVSREKGLPVLEAAFRDLCKRGVKARLVVVGDGPYRAEMEQKLAGLPALFTGFVGGKTLPQLYASSDALVFPSTTDTFGNVVLEAQASGIPVIVTDQGGPQENLIPGETGYIVPADDPAALADAMERLVRDAARRRHMGITAREYLSSRGFKEAFEQLFAMYIGEAETPAADKTRDLLRHLPLPQQLAS
ncbi:MAG: glycosyltransferase [Candidatus Hydrogenedens sp.]|nr:glycosyltransferase [Candidatus Hydrogenedens sp.]